MADESYRGPDAAPRGRRGAPAQRAPAEKDVLAELDELRRRVQQNDDEIDALQIAAARGEERASLAWYREPGLIISIVALLFSFGTTVVSYARLDQEREHAVRTELTGYMQRLGELPRLATEVRLQYGDVGSSELLGFVNAETELIANQARAAMLLIPNQVATLEYVTVGYAFQTTGAFSQAEELYRLATAVADGPLDRVTAYRSLAGISFLLHDYATGRDFYGQARDIYLKEVDAPELVVASVNAQTEIQWAQAELGAGQCAAATTHADAADALVRGESLVTFAPLVAQLRAALNACPTVSPSPAASPLT